MTSDSRYGTIGAIALTLGGILIAAGVTFHDVGTDPDQLVLGAGMIGILLVAVGILGLLSLQFDVYEEETV